MVFGMFGRLVLYQVLCVYIEAACHMMRRMAGYISVSIYEFSIQDRLLRLNAANPIAEVTPASVMT